MISVVIPVHNTGKDLPVLMDSVLAQTYRDFEIIIVENGSVDDSYEICDSYLDIATVIHTKKFGLSYARNVGICHANGDYIIFPDTGDTLDKDYLDILMRMTVYQTDLAICGYTSCETGGMKHIYKKKLMYKELLHPYRFCGFAWNKLYHMDIIKEHELFFDERLGMAQDLDFAFRYLNYCERIIYFSEDLYHYHRDGVTSLKAPLTQNKLKAFNTYKKIISMTDDATVKHICRRAMFNTSLDFIYSYYENHMENEKILSLLKTILELYKKDFFFDGMYSIPRKCVALVALFNPEMHYKLMKLRHP